jgi:hypothetical protein
MGVMEGLSRGAAWLGPGWVRTEQEEVAIRRQKSSSVCVRTGLTGVLLELHHPPVPSPQWAGVLSRLALEQERILNPLLDRVRTADHHQLRSLTGLIRNLSRNARNKDEMCESGCPLPSPHPLSAQPAGSWLARWRG